MNKKERKKNKLQNSIIKRDGNCSENVGGAVKGFK